MSKILASLAIIILFSTPCLMVGMESEAVKQQSKRLKIQTSDEQEFGVALPVAKTSEMLKNMIEDIGEEVQSIPLENISGQQFDLLLPAMLQLAQLHTTLPQASEEKLAQQLQQVVTDLKSDGQSLSNQKLIEFVASANFLNIPLVEPALEVLAKRTLNKDDIQKLVDLQNKLKDLWDIHPAMRMFSCQHPYVKGVIGSRDGNLISWSWEEGTIKVWDINNLVAEPITLRHSGVCNVIKNRDGNLISCGGNTIKVWDKNNLQAEPITLQHPWISGVIENRDGNLISWSYMENTIKVWDINNLQAEPITLQHHWVEGVIENRDGNLISWSHAHGNIKVWDKNNLQAEPITLQHPYVYGVIVSRDGNLISWSCIEGIIKVWVINNLQAEPIAPQHPWISAFIESRDGNLISWSCVEGTIKVSGVNNLQSEPIILQHPWVSGVIESRDGNLISWSWEEGTIKVWEKDTFKELTTLQHPGVMGVIGSRDGNLISWSRNEGTIKIWDRAFYNPTPELIQLLLTVYFASEGQKFELTAQELAGFKATFATLSPVIQRMLEKQAPDFVATIKAQG